jgi:hypothetical protein
MPRPFSEHQFSELGRFVRLDDEEPGKWHLCERGTSAHSLSHRKLVECRKRARYWQGEWEFRVTPAGRRKFEDLETGEHDEH